MIFALIEFVLRCGHISFLGSHALDFFFFCNLHTSNQFNGTEHLRALAYQTKEDDIKHHSRSTLYPSERDSCYGTLFRHILDELGVHQRLVLLHPQKRPSGGVIG